MSRIGRTFGRIIKYQIQDPVLSLIFWLGLIALTFLI